MPTSFGNLRLPPRITNSRHLKKNDPRVLRDGKLRRRNLPGRGSVDESNVEGRENSFPSGER
jgi:hypothetical protein